MKLSPEAVSRLLLAHADVLLAFRHIRQAIDRRGADGHAPPDLPALVQRGIDAHNTTLDVFADVAPDVIGAMRRRLPSTDDLHTSEKAPQC